MNYARLLSNVLTVGEWMLCSGAEVSRVEDSMVRICTAYGAIRVDVFTITSSIVVSADFQGKTFTQTRRITTYSTNLDMLDKLNSLSRYICVNLPDEQYIENELKRISEKKDYAFVTRLLFWSLTAGAFTVFFGGGLFDGLVSAVIGMFLMVSVDYIAGKGLNKVFSNLICSFFVTVLAYLSVRIGAGESMDKIIIGNIMLLIPGLALTNSLRDLIGGDIMSGVLRFCEACLIAIGIAAGYYGAVMLVGGIAV